MSPIADNITIPASGSGSATPVVATDDVAGVHYQRVKLDFGGDGATTPVVAATGLPVNPVQETAGVGVGAAADAEATGNGSVIAILKRLRTLLSGGLPAALTAGGGVKVGVVDAIPAGSNTIGAVNVRPATSGGLSISRVISAASTNATSVKASAGQVFGWYVFNANASTRYLKLYNKASAPTVGTDTPVMTIPIPGGAAANVEYANGIAFGTGIGLALTTGVADSDTGAVAANEIVVNLLYA